MALNGLVDSFCHNQKKRGTGRIKGCKQKHSVGLQNVSFENDPQPHKRSHTQRWHSKRTDVRQRYCWGSVNFYHYFIVVTTFCQSANKWIRYAMFCGLWSYGLALDIHILLHGYVHSNQLRGRPRKRWTDSTQQDWSRHVTTFIVKC